MLEPQERKSGIYRIRKEGEEYLYEVLKPKVVTEEPSREDKSRSDVEEWVSRCKFDLTPRSKKDFKDICLTTIKRTRSRHLHTDAFAPWQPLVEG